MLGPSYLVLDCNNSPLILSFLHSASLNLCISLIFQHFDPTDTSLIFYRKVCPHFLYQCNIWISWDNSCSTFRCLTSASTLRLFISATSKLGCQLPLGQHNYLLIQGWLPNSKASTYVVNSPTVSSLVISVMGMFSGVAFRVLSQLSRGDLIWAAIEGPRIELKTPNQIPSQWSFPSPGYVTPRFSYQHV